jgi:hypothetical protein
VPIVNRVAARDVVEAVQRSEGVDPALLDAAKEAWARDVLGVASGLNRALGIGYSVVKQLAGGPEKDGMGRDVSAVCDSSP